MQTIVIKKTAVLFLLAALICSVFAGCAGKQPRPEDTISRLQEAINQFDVEGFLQCIESRRAQQLEALLSFAPGETGISAKSFFTMIKTMIPILPFVNKGALTSGDLPKVAFTVQKTEISGSSAAAALSGILTWGEYAKSFSVTVEMKLEDDAWVVCGVS